MKGRLEGCLTPPRCWKYLAGYQDTRKILQACSIYYQFIIYLEKLDNYLLGYYYYTTFIQPQYLYAFYY